MRRTATHRVRGWQLLAQVGLFGLCVVANAPSAEACCNGDVDGSTVIDAADLALATACSNQPAGVNDPCRPSDINCDGIVDTGDLDIIDCQIVAGHDLGCCVPSPCNADYNNDGAVSIADLGEFITCSGEQPLPPDACYQTDSDCSGEVDLEDLRIALCQLKLGQPTASCCESPPIISTESPGTFCILGDGNNSSWSWQINNEPPVTVPGPAGTDESDLRGAFVTSVNANAPEELRLLVAPGPGPACFQMATCCNSDLDRDGTVTTAEVQFVLDCAIAAPPVSPGDPCFPADIDCDGVPLVADVSIALCSAGGPPDASCCPASVLPLEFKVGDAGGTIDCFVSGNPLGCAFNPMIYEEQFLPSLTPALGLGAVLVAVLLLAGAGLKLARR